MTDKDTLGWEPKMIFPLSGVTFGECQEALTKTARLFSLNHRLDNYTGGLWLVPETKNEYDKYAIAVHAATGIDGTTGKFNAWSKVGYVPRRWCPSCGNFVQLKKRQEPICQNCAMTLVNLPESYLNIYITEHKKR